MARFSEAFLVLRASDAGLHATLIPLVLVVMNIVHALVSAPAGSLSDRVDRRLLLLAGLVVLIIADVVLAWSHGVFGVLVGVGLWGLHMGLTQGLLAALVVDAAPANLRGTGSAYSTLRVASPCWLRAVWRACFGRAKAPRRRSLPALSLPRAPP